MALLSRSSTAILRSAIAPVLLAAVVGCATYRGEIPVSSPAPERTYISPGVPDGVQDRLIVGASVTEAYQNMRIGGWRFTVTDAAGVAVRTIGESVVPEQPRTRFVLRPPEGIKVPASFIWEGRNDNGDLVQIGRASCRERV